ncbi:MAG: hypothetical protein M0Z49_16590 [Chloroflexi bacterium]|nr:hypothetical protein [Chloroflexota bacterium]
MLLGILAITGIAAVALSSKELVAGLALAALIVALVVVVGVMRASR